MAPPLEHLFVAGYVDSEPFRSTLKVFNQGPPLRERRTHSQTLLRQLQLLSQASGRLDERRRELELPTQVGMTIALEISPQGSVDYFRQLEWSSDGIEVLSAVDAGGTEIVSLHVPEGKLSAFERRIREYMTRDGKPPKDGSAPKPKNAALVNAIASFRMAAFDELWTDTPDPPDAEVNAWYQVWLRLKPGGGAFTRAAFADVATKFNLTVDTGYVSFPGRTVVAVHGTRNALQNALELLDMVAEIRSVTPTAAFFLANIKPFEQAQWIANLRDRTTFPGRGSPSYVTLLDTGVNRGHPLLAAGLHEDDLHAVGAAWGSADHHGHGTEMAGLVLHGDLTPALAGGQPNDITHRLESVKILPPNGANAPHLYGWVTAQAAQVVQTTHPARNRTFAMMTTSTGHTAGLPSEWSAQIDRLAFGLGQTDTGALLPDGRIPQLFVLSAGNVDWTDWHRYPVVNDVSAIENPGQSWNALTVGAYTRLTDIDGTAWPSLRALSPRGGLSAASRTTLLWRQSWPFKPDVVAEGGNASRDATRGDITVGPESLRLLTTSHDVARSPLTESGDTSAAAAEVARICGILQTRYPSYWPETIRALVVHGARLTPQMLATLPLVPNAQNKRNVLRRYGYGAVDLNRSTVSLASEPTLVLQEEITPYARQDGKVKLGNLNMHSLPWPRDQLLALGERQIALRVTLSYFIEPNPAARGWQSKFRYQSHGLRFAVNAATETLDRFRQRINLLVRETTDGEEQESMPDPDREGWFLGATLRTRGSIHSDAWFGTAAKLAAKSHIAVFLVGGWWKDWSGSNRDDESVRYALVVTLDVLDGADIDIYTPIATLIGVPIPIEGT